MVTSSKVTQPCHDGDSLFQDRLLSSRLPCSPSSPASQLRGDPRPWFHWCLLFSVPHLTSVSVHSINGQVGRETPRLNPLLCGPPPMSPRSRFPQTWTQSSPLIASTKALGPIAHTHSLDCKKSLYPLPIPVHIIAIATDPHMSLCIRHPESS